MSVGRRSAMPNIWVQSVEVNKPPYDEPGVIQEFVGKGAIHEYEIPKAAEDFTPTSVQNVLDSIEKSIGPLRDDYKLTYNLLVRSPKASPLSSRSVRMRARAFARIKNPFEPDVISVGEARFNDDKWGDIKGDVYEVSATVTK